MAKDPELRREQNVEGGRARDWKRKLVAPDNRRTLPVRLTDVPLPIRMDAARAVCRDESPSERPAILAAALFPSDDVFWVAA